MKPDLYTRAYRDRQSQLLVSIRVLGVAAALTGCDSSIAPDSVSGPPSVVATVTVAPADAIIFLDGSVQLSAEPKDGAGRVLAGRTVMWTTSAPAIATVSEAGLVRAMGEGTATITATAGVASGSSAVTVTRHRLRIQPDTVVIAALAQTGTYTAILDGVTPTTATLVVLTESRWLAERPVLDSIALRMGQLVAHGAGTVTLLASAPAATADTFVVAVRPTQPHVLTMSAPARVGDGDAVTLRGFALQLLNDAAVTVGAVSVAPALRDSASFQFSLPSIRPADCSGHADTAFAVAVAGASIEQPLSLRRKRAGEVTLQPGEMARLSPPLSCVQLAPEAGAEYALAYFEPSVVQRTTTWSPTAPPYIDMDRHTIQLMDQSRTPAGATALRNATTPVAPIATLEHSHVPSATEIAMVQRFAPYVVGDTFTYTFLFEAVPDLMEVVRVYGDDYVLAVPKADVSTITATLYARFDSAFVHLKSVATPKFFEPIFGQHGKPDWRPPTGQILFHAKQLPGAIGEQGFGYANSVVGLRFGTDPSVGGLISWIGHELVHIWDAWLDVQQRLRGEPTGWRQQWAVEGIADLIANDISRNRVGIDFFANIGFQNDCPPPVDVVWWCNAMRGSNGEIGAGYKNSAIVMRDFVTRLTRAGWVYDDALRAVVLGARNSWYGCGPYGSCTLVGLAELMQSEFGSAWTPADGILQFVLSVAADDHLSGDRFKVPSFLQARRGFREVAHFRTGGVATFSPALCSGTQASNTCSLAAGATGWVLINDSIGGSIELLGDRPALEWAVLRIR